MHGPPSSDGLDVLAVVVLFVAVLGLCLYGLGSAVWHLFVG